MARTIDQIYGSILDAKTAEPGLDGLTSTSRTAIWRLWAYITAVVLSLHEQLWDSLKAEIEAIVARAVPGTLSWYAQRVLEFQYSDTDLYFLNLVDGKLQYNVVSEDDRIVTRVSVTDAPDGTVTVKTAKGSGVLSPLSPSELTSLRGYLDKIRFAGTYIITQSEPADKLSLNLTIVYDPIVSLQLLKTSVEAAINSYLENGVEFDGDFYVIRLQDYIQGVTGVVDVEVDSIIVSPSLVVDRKVRFASGYAVIDPDFELEDTITYVPSI